MQSTDASIGEAIRAARARHQADRSGRSTVLDLVLEALAAQNGAAEIRAMLSQSCGQDAGRSVNELKPDFSSWTIELAQQQRCVVAVSPAGSRLVVAADRWDETVVQQVARVLGAQPAVAATMAKQLNF